MKLVTVLFAPIALFFVNLCLKSVRVKARPRAEIQLEFQEE